MRDKQGISYYQRKRHELIDMLGGCCVWCGSKENLHFDHVDPSTVEFRIARGLTDFKFDVVVEEAKKCQLLCPECHKEKTRQDKGWKKIGTHGTLNTYTIMKCRCDECRRVWNEKTREYKRKERARKAS